MKKIYGFAFASAIMMLASCSNENEPNPAPAPDGEVNGYVSFHITTPNNTRAGEVGDFYEGTDGERNVKDATFLFFDASGAQTQAPQTVALSKDADATNALGQTSPISDIMNPVVAVSGRDDKKPTSVIVVVNCPGDLKFNMSQNKEAVLAKVTDSNISADNAFTMSNAAYFDKTTQAKVVETPLVLADGTSLVKETRDLAKANPVDIYVERLAAKVELSFATDDQGKPKTLTPTPFKLDINGLGNVEVTPVITALTVANKAKTMNVVKSIEDGWKDLAISEPTNFRINWANTPIDTELENDSYTGLTSGVNNANKTGLSLEEAVATPIYVKENTLASGKEISNKTSVLITAKLTYKNKEGETANLDLVRWAGVYYTPTDFLTQACNFLAPYYVKTTDASGNEKYDNFVTKDDLDYQDAAAHKTDWDATLAANVWGDQDFMQYETKVIYKGTEPSEIYTYDADKNEYTAVTLKENQTITDVLNAELAKKANRCWYWAAGTAYYYVEIAAGNDAYDKTVTEKDEDSGEETSKVVKSSEFEYGVVRNNCYQISLRSLTGVGVPIYNPNEVIIPQTPSEKLWYVGARINVLKWRTVKQDGDFGKNNW